MGGQEGDFAAALREHPVREIARNGEVVVVRLAGELDLYNAEEVRRALREAVAEGPRRLVIDLGAVTFIDSTSLGVLIEARTGLLNRRGFLLASPGIETQRALAVAGLDRHFSVHATVEDALAAEI